MYTKQQTHKNTLTLHCAIRNSAVTHKVPEEQQKSPFPVFVGGTNLRSTCWIRLRSVYKCHIGICWCGCIRPLESPVRLQGKLLAAHWSSEDPCNSCDHLQSQEEGVQVCVSAVGVAWHGSHDAEVSHLWGGWTDTPMIQSVWGEQSVGERRGWERDWARHLNLRGGRQKDRKPLRVVFKWNMKLFHRLFSFLSNIGIFIMESRLYFHSHGWNAEITLLFLDH